MKYFLSALIAIGLSIAAAPSFAADARNVTVVNETGYAIKFLGFNAPDDGMDEWDNELDKVLQNQASTYVEFDDDDEGCVWNIRVDWQNYDETVLWKNVNLCKFTALRLRYDSGTKTWVQLSAKPTAVSDVQAVVVGNKIYVPGGRLASGAISDRLEAYDPQRESWTTLKPLPQPRTGYALAAVEGKLYLFGGWDGSTYRAEVWQYDPDQDSWTERKPMPTARAFSGAATTPEGQVYIVGGESTKGALTVNEHYIPAEETGGSPWSVQAPLPAPRSHMAVATASELVFVLSGADASGDSLLYNSTIDAWQPLKTPLGPNLRDLRAQAVGNNLYILGGRDDHSDNARAYEYQALYSVLLPLESSR